MIRALILSAVSIATSHVDNLRTNSNTNEAVLSPSTVTNANFHFRGNYAVDGAVYTQPLYIPDVTVSSVVRNVVIVATMHNSVYAFDADNPGSAALWHAGPLATSRTSYPFQSSNTFLYGGEVGCLATPAVDQANGWVFVICTNSTPTWVLYKLNLSTGATISTVTISGSVVGTGDPNATDCTSGPNLLFCPAFALIRSGVTIANNRVYLFFGSYDDQHPWHGWAFAYLESDLSQVGLFCTSPNGYGGSFWAAGGGPSVDASGNLYDVTGNGDWNGTSNFGDTFLKFDQNLNLLDWFTPSDWATINSTDADLSSNRTLLIPSAGYLIGGGKDFRVFVLRTSDMGHLQGGGGTAPVQVFKSNAGGSVTIFSGSYGMAYVGTTLYMPTTNGSIYSFAFGGTTFNTTPTISGTTYSFPGAATIGGSSYGTANKMLWMTSGASSAYSTQAVGTLRALNSSTMAEIWNSNTTGGDSLGTLAKYSSPTVANGRVYVATLDNVVKVYGLPLSGSSIQGQTKISGQVTVQ